MTIQKHARFIVERVVTEFSYEDRRYGSDEYTYWEVLAMIKHAYEINAFNRFTAERYCYLMHCSFEEMLTA